MQSLIVNSVQISRVNNFNLIRLLAALQVVLLHTYSHLNIRNQWLIYFLDFCSYFPGVPIFFAVSGFLIFWSIDRSYSGYLSYWKNRILRIYPALWFCTVGTVILLFVFDKIFVKESVFWSEVLWLVGQISFYQFYTIPSLREFGIGVPNGALWTITIELQFYALAPILLNFIKRNQNYFFLFFVFSILFYSCLKFLPEDVILTKVATVTVFPYLFNFLIGAAIYIWWKDLQTWLTGRFPIWLLIYLSYAFIFHHYLQMYGHDYMPNLLGLISIILLSLTVLSAGFTRQSISGRLLSDVDISYGLYIYHMPVINLFYVLGLTAQIKYFLFVPFVVGALSFFSWIFIERPALTLKGK